DLIAQDIGAPGTGQPPTRVIAPFRSTSRAGSPALSSHDAAAAPRTIAAVAAILASTHVPATTLTVRQGPAAGSPVAGSMMWCNSIPPRRQRRTVVLEVATPPARMAIVSPSGVISARLFSAI